MSSIFIEGGYPLQGEVKPTGSRMIALKLIAACILSNDSVVLDNVPKVTPVLRFINLVKYLGGSADWFSENKLQITGANISSYEIPKEYGINLKHILLFAGPLLHRFGKAVIPVPVGSPINRWIDSWESLGVDVEEKEGFIYLTGKNLHGANINFRTSTHTGTDNAILSSVFIEGETFIVNAAEEPEVGELIEFLNMIGGQIERVEPRRIRIIGKNVFTGGFFEIQSDSTEVVAYATAALVTEGNISIKGISKLGITAYVNFLAKIGAKYEYLKDTLSVWCTGEPLKPTDVITGPFPGFLSEWLPYSTLLLSMIEGNSTLHDTVYLDRMGFVQDMNRMGASVEVVKPSDVGQQCVISDDSYNFGKYGEPNTVIKVTGVEKFRGMKIGLSNSRFDPALIIACFSASGKSEIQDFENNAYVFDKFLEKLMLLGAHFTK